MEDDGELTSGQKRNALRKSARGRYVAFVDDDDMVSEGYVASLLCAIEQSSPDVVTFDVLRRHGKDEQRQVFLLGARDHIRRLDGCLEMTANHLCAWKKEIARSVGFPNALGYNDDVFWYMPMIASGLTRTEVHLDEVLYYYNWAPDTTENQRQTVRERTYQWAAGGVRAYWSERGIVTDIAGFEQQGSIRGARYPEQDKMRVVADGDGTENIMPASRLKVFHTTYAR